MRNVRFFLTLMFCASLAAGILSAQCPPKADRIDPAPPQGIPGDATSTVTVYGSCFPTDLSQLVIGFSDSQNTSGLPVRVTSLFPDHIVMSVDAPLVNRASRRQFAFKIGSAEPVKTALFLQINPTTTGNPNSGQGTAGGHNSAPPPGGVEYVTNPVMMRQMRRVDAKADKAIGISNEAIGQVSNLEKKVDATQNALTNAAKAFEQYFGSDGNGGTFGNRLTNVENGLAEHQQAIAQIRQEIDNINKRQIPAAASPDQLQKLSVQIQQLSEQLGMQQEIINSILRAKIKVGAKHELGQSLGMKKEESAPPSGEGYRNPIK